MKESKFWLAFPLIVILLAGALGFLMLWERQAAKAETARLEALIEEARPYLEEQERIRSEMTQKSENYTVTFSSTGVAVVSYELDGVEELEAVKYYADAYGIRPVVVLDLTSANLRYSNDIDMMVAALNETDFEVAFTADNFDESDLFKADPIRKSLLHDAGCFLLRSTDDTQENRALITQAGYQSYVQNSEDGSIAVQEDGMICLSYMDVNTSSTDINSHLDTLNRSELTTMFLFSVADMGTEKITIDMNLIRDYVSGGGVECRGVKGAIEHIYEEPVPQEVGRESYLAYLSEQKTRIAELQKIVKAIYDEA